jgi:alkanesulfonate monooxygenase SsuD/methylene tetrahydromethanopterin reductase-like flavin-dependent oxidoreductase (luciferase family)
MSARAGLWLPLFDELADPTTLVRLAVEAEEAGWDGFFVWDHVAWRAPIRAVADPWVVLSAVAAVTSRLVLGPMVTPLARRRAVKVARETATLDRLSGGRLVLGVGLGSDRFGGEYSRTGEPVDDRTRAEVLDESLAVLLAAWSGVPVHHHGHHVHVDGIAFHPTPVGGSVPVWVAGFPGNKKPMARAAAHDGFFPVNLTSPDQLAEAVSGVDALRDAHRAFDIVVSLERGVDPAPYTAAGATWLLTDFDPATLTLDAVQGVLRDGPVRA